MYVARRGRCCVDTQRGWRRRSLMMLHLAVWMSHPCVLYAFHDFGFHSTATGGAPTCERERQQFEGEGTGLWRPTGVLCC